MLLSLTKDGLHQRFLMDFAKIYTIHYDSLEFSEHLFYRTSFDGCFYTFWKKLFLRTIFYLEKSENIYDAMDYFAATHKNSNFSG